MIYKLFIQSYKIYIYYNAFNKFFKIKNKLKITKLLVIFTHSVEYTKFN